jgi:hypothetical protein
MEYSSSITVRVQESNEVNVQSSFTGRDVTVTDFIRKELTLVPAATDVVFDFGYVSTAKYIYISTNKKITVKANGIDALRAITVTSVLVLGNDNVTSLYFSNPGTESATVEVLLVG